jgi:hypothetical protein
MNPGNFRLAVVVTALTFAAGCATFGFGRLEPGKSTVADVEAKMGRPAERINLPGGESVWHYPRGQARQTFSVRIGADGVVRDVSQVLTMQNLAKIQPRRSTSDEVRALLGPPFGVSANPRLERDLWEYYMYEDQRPIIVVIQFDPTKRVREILRLDDPAFQGRGEAMGGGF